MVLKMLFAGTVTGLWDIFPSAGFVSDNFDQYSFWGKFRDLPCTCSCRFSAI